MAGYDLVLLGQVNMVLGNGAELELPFACHLVAKGAIREAKGSLIKYMRVYAVNAHLIFTLVWSCQLTHFL